MFDGLSSGACDSRDGSEGMHRTDKVREGGGVRMCLMD